MTQTATLGYWMGERYAGKRLHDRARSGRSSPSPSARSACTGWRPPACRTTPPRCASWKRSASAAKATRGPRLHQRPLAGSPSLRPRPATIPPDADLAARKRLFRPTYATYEHRQNRSGSRRPRLLRIARLIAVLRSRRRSRRRCCRDRRRRARSGRACRSTAGPSTSPARSSSSTSRPTASRFRPRRAPTASCAASRCARRKPAAASDWIVFALANLADEQIDRLLVVPHFRLVGSGLIWPDLGAERIGRITPSEGFAPERQASQEADIFRITLDPGAIVTYVAELSDRGAAGDPSLGRRRLRGHGQQLHALSRRGARHRRACSRCS